MHRSNDWSIFVAPTVQSEPWTVSAAAIWSRCSCCTHQSPSHAVTLVLELLNFKRSSRNVREKHSSRLKNCQVISR
jgi:hypothetical protein